MFPVPPEVLEKERKERKESQENNFIQEYLYIEEPMPLIEREEKPQEKDDINRGVTIIELL